MSFCNKCGKWAGAFAASAGANTDHLCKCLTPAQQSILDALSYEQHQRERIEAAKRYDTEQNKPSLTSGVLASPNDQPKGGA